MVAIELFPESEWSCPSGLVMKDAEEEKVEENVTGDDDEVNSDEHSHGEKDHREH